LSVLGSFRGRIAALAGVIVVLLGAGSWIALTHASAQSTTKGAGGQAASGQHSTQAAQATPLQVVSVTPAGHTKDVNGADPVKVTFSAAVATDSPMPTVKPHVGGVWKHVGTDAIEFVPTRGFAQLSHVKVHIPGGATGVKSTSGGVLAKSKTVHFETGAYSAERLGELLAQLGYLPLTWTPAGGQSAPAAGDATGQLAAAYTPPTGSFAWKPGYPHELHTFWSGGSATGLIIHGAVMAFESEHAMTMDGIAGTGVWKALLKAAAKDETNTNGYTYARASQHSPESLTVWHDGHVVFKSLANTGIPAAPTTVGTAAVYLKYTFQIMRGKNPDGSKYADPVRWVSYFRAGEAVHYFPRGSYGFQQSLGCVELPLAPAAKVYPYLTFGTLVTVTPS
jgi:L,D-transpeptidase catalytic domain